jgi:hypothetical protein
MKIYLKLENPPENVIELIKALYNPIISYGSYFKSKATYSDENCTKIQCYENKYRSFDDVYFLCTTYFPEMTVKEVFHALLMTEFCKDSVIQFASCSTMGRVRFIPYTTLPYDYRTLSYIFTRSKFQSMWSWRELFDMVDIKTDSDLANYRKNNTIIKDEEIKELA